MKFIILTLLTLSSTGLYASGGDGCESCKKKTVEIHTSVDSKILEVATKLETQRADEEIKKMCETFHKARSFGANGNNLKPHYLLKQAVAKFHSIKQNDKGINKKVEKFWNKYNDRLVCRFSKDMRGKSLKSYKKGIHFAKLVIHHNSSSNLFGRYLLSEGSKIKNLNFNAIETHNGKPETIIDYIDTILNDPKANLKYDVDEIKDLREWLMEEHKALKAKDISV